MTDSSKNIHGLLRDTGYLDSPANRFFWKNATPTMRNHIRQFGVVSLSASLPFAILFASLTLLEGWDRLFLFLFYMVALTLGFLAVDVAVGLVVRQNALERFWRNSPWLNWLPLPVSAALLLLTVRFLHEALAFRSVESQVLAWIASALSSWIAAKGIHLLIISRLYWHGIRPPRLHHYRWIMVLALGAIGVFQLRQIMAISEIPALTPQKRQPMLFLAFDLPEPMFDAYASRLPGWPRQRIEAAERDITQFWTSVGTGTPPSRHRASLHAFKTPLFRRYLNRRDPTQRAPLNFFQWIGRADPLAEGGRFRKYVWEILDDYGLRTYAFAFWHSFPASSQFGGVLSERWSRESASMPYLTGLSPLEPDAALPLAGPDALHPTIQRENQTWAQLRLRAEASDFDFCIAYFPLGDLLVSEDRQQELLAFRSRRMQSLFESLGQDTRVGILLASGKPEPGQNRIRIHMISNWFSEDVSPFSSHLALAPSILHYFGLPPDRLMAAPTVKDPADLAAAVDYGEPNRTVYQHPPSDSSYYEELKTLGYVQ